jgi:hypothetical protein
MVLLKFSRHVRLGLYTILFASLTKAVSLDVTDAGTDSPDKPVRCSPNFC